MKWLLFVLITNSAWALIPIKASFTDSCTGKTTGLTGHGGVNLNLEIEKLNPSLPLTVEVTWRPAGLFEDLSGKKTLLHRYRRSAMGGRGLSVPESGNLLMRLKLPKDSWMSHIEQRFQTSRLWQADVLIYQDGGDSGRAGSTIARMLPGKQSFFKVTGSSMCVWQSKPNVASKPYENRTNSFMNVKRDYMLQWQQGWMKGLSVGPSNQGMATPMLGNFENYGWLYKEWQTSFYHDQIFSLEKKWVLNREEIGLFANRMSFTRLPVKKIEWQRVGQCGEWIESGEGFLDVGIETEDFYTVPRSALTDLTRASEIINMIHPPLDTCPSHVGRGAEYAQQIIPNGISGLMFFYPKDNK
jgi:hypothetical protein